MKHLPTLAVGIVSYLSFVFAAIYAVSFTFGGLFPDPISIPHATPILALLVDVGLILAFGLQHTVMARSRWKALWTSIVPSALERSLYVLFASGILLALFWCWQPIPSVIWHIDYPLVRTIVYGICLAGWILVVLSTFQIDHFELFGLRQVWQAFHRLPQLPTDFRKPFLYRLVRHPMMAGFLLVFWATPTMTVDRLTLALGMTIYILIGLAFEERALRRQFGATYEKYQAEVPRLFPHPRRLHGKLWTKLRITGSGSVTNTQ
ncbi:MAG TPA: methyltransferase [Ktedonobacterales bacterium]|nr:methyltransferase [Ktedonobacterales bacterium]